MESISGRRGQHYPAELRERAVRVVAEVRAEHGWEWDAMLLVATKLGVGSTETVRKWVRRAEVETGTRPAPVERDSAEVRKLRSENRELRRANEILKAAARWLGVRRRAPRSVRAREARGRWCRWPLLVQPGGQGCPGRHPIPGGFLVTEQHEDSRSAVSLIWASMTHSGTTANGPSTVRVPAARRAPAWLRRPVRTLAPRWCRVLSVRLTGHMLDPDEEHQAGPRRIRRDQPDRR